MSRSPDSNYDDDEEKDQKSSFLFSQQPSNTFSCCSSLSSAAAPPLMTFDMSESEETSCHSNENVEVSSSNERLESSNEGVESSISASTISIPEAPISTSSAISFPLLNFPKDSEEQEVLRQLAQPMQQANKTYQDIEFLGSGANLEENPPPLPTDDKSLLSVSPKLISQAGVCLESSGGICSCPRCAKTSSSSSSSGDKLSSFPTLVINMTKCIIGSGILYLPVKGYRIGLIPAIGLLGFSAVFSAFGLGLFLFLCSKIGRNSSIKTLSEATYQMIGMFFNVLIVVKCLLVATLYLSIAITTGKTLFELGDGDGYFYALQAAIFLFTVPLSLLKKIGKLKYTSYAGVLAVLYLVFFSGILFAFYRGGDGNGNNRLKLLEGTKEEDLALFQPFDWKLYLSAIPSFMFAFTCHQNVFPFYNEAKNNSLSSMYRMVAISVTTSFVIYAAFTVFVIGVFGDYLKTGIEQKKTILDIFISKFSGENAFIRYSAKFSGIIYVLLLLFSFPMQILPVKSSTLSLLPVSGERIRKQEAKINIILSLFSVFTCFLIYLITLKFEILGKLSNIIGAFASPLMMSTLPALYFLKIQQQHHQFRNRRWNVRRILIGAFGVTGMIMVPLCLYSVFSV